MKRFISRYIDSVGRLEVLLLLRSREDRPWSAEEVSRELRSNPTIATHHLEALASFGLLQAEGAGASYSYAPKTPSLRETVGELASQYSSRRVTIIGFIYESPVDPSIRSFADAFKIRKED
ncbi:MAG: helix-turn-helix transcriptional regulator [Bdellovibrionaceae bacterium]|nr:helix-turn-helix transcriptional regulator [Pseudobdellovibrionaceae bacterium]